MENKNDYKAVLKATSMIGGATMVTTLLGMIKVKAIALTIGPSGVGLISIFTNIINIAVIMLGIGINTSAVRDIANRVGKGDVAGAHRVIGTVRIFLMLVGAFGVVFFASCSRIIANQTFGNLDHTREIFFLGLVVVFNLSTIGENAIIQGYRKVTTLARLAVFGALIGLFVSLPILIIFRLNGIIPSLLVTAISVFGVTAFSSRKITGVVEKIHRRLDGGTIKGLLSIGFPLMLSSLIASLNLYIVNYYLLHTLDLDALGNYQAVNSLTSVLVSLVLGAMAADYYPRLSMISDDDAGITRLANTQTEICLLLSIPIVGVIIQFVPYIIIALYSSRFAMAGDVLRWSVFGVLGRVLSWPLGYILLAKKNGKMYLAVELFSSILNVLLVITCLQLFGFIGLGIASPVYYLLYLILIKVVSYAKVKFKWSRPLVFRIVGSTVALLAVLLVNLIDTSAIIKWGIGIPINVVLLVLSYKGLKNHLGFGVMEWISRFSHRPKPN
jgi:antigen flippase